MNWEMYPIEQVCVDLSKFHLSINNGTVLLRPRKRKYLFLAWIAAWATKNISCDKKYPGLTWNWLLGNAKDLFKTWGIIRDGEFLRKDFSECHQASSWEVISQNFLNEWNDGGNELLEQIFKSSVFDKEVRLENSIVGPQRRYHFPGNVIIDVYPDGPDFKNLVAQIEKIGSVHQEPKDNMLKNYRLLLEQYTGAGDVFLHIDDLFIKPHSFDTILQAVQKYIPLLIIGNPGNGKSYLAYYLLYRALMEGRPVERIKDPFNFQRRYDTCENFYSFQHQILKKEGFLLLDDIWGRDSKQLSTVEMDDILKNLCFCAQGYPCSIVMTSRKVILNEKPDYISQLEEKGVFTVDLSHPDYALPENSRRKLFSKLVAIRDPQGERPITKLGLIDEGGKMAEKYKLSPFATEIFARRSLALVFSDKLEEDAKSVAKDEVQAIIKFDSLSKIDQNKLMLLALLEGIPLDDVKNLFQSGTIIPDEKNTDIKTGIDSLWTTVFNTRNDAGQEHYYFRHSLFAEHIEKYMIRKGNPNLILGWLKQLITYPQDTIACGAVRAAFRYKDILNESFLEILGIAISSGSESVKYLTVYHLGPLMEHDPSSNLVKYFMNLFHDPCPFVHIQCMRAIIYGWEKMDHRILDALKQNVKRCYLVPWKLNQADYLFNLLTFLSRKPSLINDFIEGLSKHRYTDVKIYARTVLSCIYKVNYVPEEFRSIVEVTYLLGKAMDRIEIGFLYEQLRFHETTLPEQERLEIMGILSQFLKYEISFFRPSS